MISMNNRVRFSCGLLVALLALFGSGQAVAQRCALVIGNANYPAKEPGRNDLGPLANPVNDARDMAKLLDDYDFVLVDHQGRDRPLINANKARMDQAVDKFVERLSGCSMAFFYFSGHGVAWVLQEFVWWPINSNQLKIINFYESVYTPPDQS